ncbi:MAG TPA: GAF domain-containing SpoIIE family protein phosphatase [Pyrinomonadaceae bacterium]|nr:GAF domain-containing SpoIIE family protein phosphatase [Pyrinomonadaceae bacterium]
MVSATAILSNLPDELRLQRLEALVVASETLNRASGLDDILQAILTLIKTQLEAERATAFLHDRRTGKLHARQMSGSQHTEIVLEKGVGVAGYVAETGESVLINDVTSDPRFDPSTDRRTGFKTRNMLCVPLRDPEGELMGSLQAINKREGEFSAADLSYLESFAALAAVAVEREQLAQEAFRSKLLSTELELARKIQQRLLPPPGKIALPAPFSAWGISQACFDVGGDAYDALVLPSGECAFWVADVSGKGIGAALLMTTLQTELRALVRAESDLARLATKLDERVMAVAPLGTYATLFLGVLSPEDERLRYINAGHVPPVWLNSQTEIERTFEVSGKLIGLPVPSDGYSEGLIDFKRGERLAVFSDGVTDAENTSGETYEEKGLAAGHAHLTAPEVETIGQTFFEDLDRFRMGAPAKDDTTYLVVGLN